MARPLRLAVGFGLYLLVGGCSEPDDRVTTCCLPTPTPSPTPTPDPTAVVAGAHTGPTEIVFLAAEPAPGSTLSGCGADASGCDGRIRMWFRLRNSVGGTPMYVVGFLHGPGKLSCWRGTVSSFRLEPGIPLDLQVAFDQRDPGVCAAPFEIATMKLVVEGTIEVASLQEWAVRYSVLR